MKYHSHKMRKLLEVKIARSVKMETGRLPLINQDRPAVSDPVSPDPGPLK